MNERNEWSSELQELIVALTEGTLNDEQLRRLEELLVNDPDARAEYHRQLWVHATLLFGHPAQEPTTQPATAEEFAKYIQQVTNPSRPVGETSEAANCVEGEASPRTAGQRAAAPPVTLPPLDYWSKLMTRGGPFLSPSSLLGMMAATFFLGAVSALVATIGVPIMARQIDLPLRQVGLEPSAPSSHAAATAASVARLTGTHDLKWADKFASPLDEQFLELKQKLELAHGWVEVTFKTGTRVLIGGPAAFELTSRTGGRLTAGKLVAEVPSQEAAFTVETPLGNLVADAGSEFGVDVTADGVGEVAVSKGKVALHRPTAKAPSQPAAAQELVAGQALQTTAAADGVVKSAPLDFDEVRFTRTIPIRFRPVQQPQPYDTIRLPANAVLITPTIQAFCSEHPGSPPDAPARAVANLVNGSGLSVGASGSSGAADTTHDNSEHHAWHRDTVDASIEAFVTFNLGAVYDLRLTRIWNLNQMHRAVRCTGNGARNIHILVSSDNVTYTSVASIVLNEGGGTSAEPAQDFTTVAHGVHFVKFEILTGYDLNNSEGGFKGLAAVRFEGVPVNAAERAKSVAWTLPTRALSAVDQDIASLSLLGTRSR